MAFQKNTGEPGRKAAMPSARRGQVSVELVIITSVMVGLLLVMLLVNNSLQTSWDSERQILEATSAASQVALAINRAAAGGDGTTISFINTVSPDVTRMEVFDRRVVRAYYKIGGYASSALVTNSTNISGNISLNRQLIISNTNGIITLTNGPEPGPVGASCGGSGEACCASDTCDGGYICSTGTCVACGAYGQPCCTSGACNTYLTCNGGTCQCGGSGQPCCSGTTCSATYACNLSSVLCQSCGAGSGQLCCAGDNCTSPFACNTTAMPQHVCYLNVSEVTCGTLSTAGATYTLTSSQSISGANCFTVTAANVTLNCNGYSITGSNASNTVGVYSDQSGTVVNNCVISNFHYGVQFNGGTGSRVNGTTANTTYSGGIGIYFSSTSYSNITNSSAFSDNFEAISITSPFNNVLSTSARSNSNIGIYLMSSGITVRLSNVTSGTSIPFYFEMADSNNVSNCTITCTSCSNLTPAMYLYESGSNIISSNKFVAANGLGSHLSLNSYSYYNTFYWNNFTATSGYYILNGGSSTYFNTSINGHGEGNIWANVLNGSVNITGTNNSTGVPSLYYGTNGSGYPYNSTTSGGKVTSNVVDYAPLTPAKALVCTWTQRTASGSRNWRSIASSSDGTKLAAVAYNDYIYTSTDSGASWTQRTSSGNRSWFTIASSSDGTKLVAADYGNYLYTSTDSGATWTQQANSSTRVWRGLASSSDGTKLVAATGYSSTSGYIYISNNSGVTWYPATNAGLGYWGSVASSSDGSNLSASWGSDSSGNEGYIYTSANSGATWTQRTASGYENWYDIASSSDGTKLAAVRYLGSAIYFSNDSGATWYTSSSPFGTRNWYSVAVSSDRLTIVTAPGNGMPIISTNGGATWTTHSDPGNRTWYGMASSSDGYKMVLAPYGSYIWTYSCQ